MRILGIDPGLVRMGLGIVESRDGRYNLVHYDVLKMCSKDGVCQRLGEIFAKVKETIAAHNIEAVAIEDVFVSVNPRSALKLGQARGAAIAAAIDAGLEVFEYTPRQVKMSISSFGGADKSQVTRMVEILLGVKGIKPYDAADALAISICHINTIPLRKSL
jgi:crossover junction endodeoxyribonuclease RuvC